MRATNWISGRSLTTNRAKILNVLPHLSTGFDRGVRCNIIEFEVGLFADKKLGVVISDDELKDLAEKINKRVAWNDKNR